MRSSKISFFSSVIYIFPLVTTFIFTAVRCSLTSFSISIVNNFPYWFIKKAGGYDWFKNWNCFRKIRSRLLLQKWAATVKRCQWERKLSVWEAASVWFWNFVEEGVPRVAWWLSVLAVLELWKWERGVGGSGRGSDRGIGIWSEGGTGISSGRWERTFAGIWGCCGKVAVRFVVVGILFKTAPSVRIWFGLWRLWWAGCLFCGYWKEGSVRLWMLKWGSVLVYEWRKPFATGGGSKGFLLDIGAELLKTRIQIICWQIFFWLRTLDGAVHVIAEFLFPEKKTSKLQILIVFL